MLLQSKLDNVICLLKTKETTISRNKNKKSSKKKMHKRGKLLLQSNSTQFNCTFYIYLKRKKWLLIVVLETNLKSKCAFEKKLKLQTINYLLSKNIEHKKEMTTFKFNLVKLYYLYLKQKTTIKEQIA